MDLILVSCLLAECIYLFLGKCVERLLILILSLLHSLDILLLVRRFYECDGHLLNRSLFSLYLSKDREYVHECILLNITILICDAVGSLCLLSVYCVGYLAYECSLVCGCIHVCHLCSKSHDPVINLHIILLLKLILPVIFSYLHAVNPSHQLPCAQPPLMSMNVFCP